MLSAVAFTIGCSDDVLTVGDIGDPFAFEGELVISGIVTHFNQNDDRVFGVKDTAEMIQCGFNLDCGAWIMPVFWAGSGDLPDFGDEVNLTGEFTFIGDDLMFQATDYEVIGNFADQLN